MVLFGADIAAVMQLLDLACNKWRISNKAITSQINVTVDGRVESRSLRAAAANVSVTATDRAFV